MGPFLVYTILDCLFLPHPQQYFCFWCSFGAITCPICLPPGSSSVRHLLVLLYTSKSFSSPSVSFLAASFVVTEGMESAFFQVPSFPFRLPSSSFPSFSLKTTIFFHFLMFYFKCFTFLLPFLFIPHRRSPPANYIPAYITYVRSANSSPSTAIAPFPPQ